MNKQHKKQQLKFQREFEMFKNHRKPDYELKNIFDIYLPFWFCRQNVVVERAIELDRFSKIILQTIQNGFSKHSEVCAFLGVETNSFVTTQFHFLLKNGLLAETSIENDTQYEITFEGLAFLEKKNKITAVETVEFDYFYNDLTLELLDRHQFDFMANNLTNEYLEADRTPGDKNSSERKRKKFSGYKVLDRHRLPSNIIEIPHKNKPYNLNKFEFANFFNQQYQDQSFYDFDSNNLETHKRSICFLAFEYEDKAGVKIYEIRHFRKTVLEFDRHELEEKISKQTTEFFKKNPLRNNENIDKNNFEKRED